MCNKIHVDAIQKIRDQLFAEAMILMKTHHHIHVDDDMMQDCTFQQEMRDAIDAWEQYIVLWLDDYMKCSNPNVVASTDVWTHALNGDINRFGRSDQMRVAQVMKKLGFEQKVLWLDERSQRRWVREPQPPKSPVKLSGTHPELEKDWQE